MKITKHTAVTLEYTLKDDQGVTIDSSKESGNFFYVHGMEQTLPGMEEILDGQDSGFTFDGIIPCEKAYGKKSKEFYMPVPKEDFENPEYLEVGMSLSIENNYGEQQEMEIIAIDSKNVTIDANSPYADMDIQFTCRVLEVREATKEELEEAQEEYEHECECED